MPLLERLVDVLVLLRLVVLPGVVVDDAPGDIDAMGGDANGEGVVGRRCVALRCRWCWCWWRWWCLSASPAGVFGEADGDGTLARQWWGGWRCG